MKLAISDIKILPRQRIDVGDITDLASSLQRLGQIQSIGVNENNELIWGMRRYLAAKSLGWLEMDVVRRTSLTAEQEQEIELEEDIKRKDRTWQEKCIAVNKLFRMKARKAAQDGERWTHEQMSSFTGDSVGSISYMLAVARCLNADPKDEEVWACKFYMNALEVLRNRAEKEAQVELDRRRNLIPKPTTFLIKELSGSIDIEASPSPLQPLTPTRPLTLFERAQLYNKTYEHLGPPNTPLYYSNRNNREFIHAFWFVGGANISDFYGSYQIEYLERINALFPEIKGREKVVHLFSGSIPKSDDYSIVGLKDANNTPDYEIDAEKLSSFLPFKPQLIFADPPYSIEDSEHYANAMVNRERVMAECALVLQPSGFLVWIDTALPIFSNNDLSFVGAIGYIRSTGNRFRCVSIFRKPSK